MSCYEDVVCVMCCLGDREETLLLCDGCDRGFHCHCLGLLGVPEGDWFCKACETPEKQEKQELVVYKGPPEPEPEVESEQESQFLFVLLCPLLHFLYLFFNLRILAVAWFIVIAYWGMNHYSIFAESRINVLKNCVI